MFLPFVIVSFFVLLCGVGAYFTANAVCQRQWKERVPQPKLAAFAAVFLAVFVALAILMLAASSSAFRR